jgi:hypothetical protein
MRTLSETLETAQKKPAARPYVEAKVYDYAQGIRRLNWTRLYTGSEADNHHGIAFDGQGSMHRIRASGSDLYRQKIASPGEASDYTQWTRVNEGISGAWLSATAHNDPDSHWSSEANAYDGNTATYACEGALAVGWNGFLELSRAAVLGSKLRVYMDFNTDWGVDKVDIDVYYSAAWHDVYEGAVANQTWVEKDIPGGPQSVTAMRIRYSHTNTEYGLRLFEAAFWQDPVAVTCDGPCAIAACGAKVYIFWRKNDNTIRKYYSHDYGASWTDAELSAYQNADSMAAAWWGTGDIVVLAVANGTVADGELNAIVLDTSDQSKAEYTDSESVNHPLLAVYGIGITYATSPERMCLVFAARQSATPYDFYALYRTELSSLYNWLAWEYFTSVPHGEGINYQYPELHLPSSPQAYEQFQFTAVELFTGDTAYSRPLRFNAVRSSEFSEMAYTEPNPFLNISSTYGLRLQSTTAYWWLERPDGVWRAPRPPDTPLDLTQDITALTQSCHPERSEGSLVIELDNSKGKYASPGEGDIASLKQRSEVVLKLGYHSSPPAWTAAAAYAEGDFIVPTAGKLTGFFYECTTAGTSHAATEPSWPTVLGETVVDNTVVWSCHSPNESSQAGVYWIDSWQWQSASGRSSFVLYCIDGSELSKSWLAHNQLRWNHTDVGPKSVWELLAAVLCRFGIRLVNAANRSTPITSLQPQLLLSPGQSAGSVISRLLDMVPDLLDYQKYSTTLGYTIACTKEPRSDDASCYTYSTQPGSHPLLEGSYQQSVPLSQVRSKGRDSSDNPLLATAFDWTLLGLGIDSFLPGYDPELTTETRNQERAAALLRRSELQSEGGRITVPVNCGQELYDVVTVTDQRCGIDAGLYRIIALEVDYSPRNGRYSHRLTLAKR